MREREAAEHRKKRVDRSKNRATQRREQIEEHKAAKNAPLPEKAHIYGILLYRNLPVALKAAKEAAANRADGDEGDGQDEEFDVVNGRPVFVFRVLGALSGYM